MQPLELNPGEIEHRISWAEGGRVFKATHTLRPPKLDDWLEYDRRLRSAMLVGTEGIGWQSDESAAAAALWDRIAIRVAGYLSRGEGGELAELCERFPAEWKTKVPIAHKLTAIQPLAHILIASPPDGEDAAWDPDSSTVWLEVLGHAGLGHTLRRPDLLQSIEVGRLRSYCFQEMPRGKQRRTETLRTVYPGTMASWGKLYDALIVSTNNYTVNGSGMTREQAVEFMDAQHKAAAMRAMTLPPLSLPEGDDGAPEEAPDGAADGAKEAA
jgi:hypothetical protein